MAEVANSPIYKITYNGKNISKDVAQYLIHVSYTDTVEGEASEFTITMEDVDANWKNNWYPVKGSTIQASIGDLDCGKFIIDEVELSGKPDIIIIKALSSISDVPKLDVAQTEALTIQKKLKTKKSKGYELQTLKQIAQSVAQHNGLTLQGKVPNITIGRVTKKRETDLKFLRRVSYDYGVIFRVMDNKLVFMSMKEIEQRGPQFTLDKTDLLHYRLKDKTQGTYAKCIVKHNSAKIKAKVFATVTAYNQDGVAKTEYSGDTAIVHRRVENQEQASAIANAVLYRKNTETQTGSIQIPGNIFAIAGNNVRLTGLGSAGMGIYHMMKVEHIVDRDGSWVVDCTIKKISNTDPQLIAKPIFESQPQIIDKMVELQMQQIFVADQTKINPVFVPRPPLEIFLPK
jgi:phage protein D